MNDPSPRGEGGLGRESYMYLISLVVVLRVVRSDILLQRAVLVPVGDFLVEVNVLSIGGNRGLPVGEGKLCTPLLGLDEPDVVFMLG